jgi:hypothetical protein
VSGGAKEVKTGFNCQTGLKSIFRLAKEAKVKAVIQAEFMAPLWLCIIE